MLSVAPLGNGPASDQNLRWKIVFLRSDELFRVCSMS